MIHNYYSIADITLKLESETVLQNNGMLKKFAVRETAPDVTVRICRVNALPESGNNLLYKDERRAVYEKDGRHLCYCCYFDAMTKSYVPYSCLIKKEEEYELYIRFESSELWDTMVLDALGFPDIMLSFGAAVMHCSFVIRNGKAILFTADKQVGKSTQASLWEKYAGAKIINGDRAAIRMKNNALYAFGVPFCGSSDISVNEQAPVAAIVELSKGKVNTLSALSPAAAFKCILGKLSYNINEKETAVRAADIAVLASKVPVYHLSCLPDEGAVRLLEEEIWKH